MCCQLFGEEPLKGYITLSSKIIGIFGAVLTLLGGIAVIISAVGSGNLNPDIVQYDYKNILSWSMFSQGLSYLIAGVFGYLCIYYYQNYWGHKSLLCCFVCNLTSLCMAAATLLGISLVLIGVHYTFQSDNQACVREELFRDSHRLYKKSSELLCSEECGCQIDSVAEDLYKSDVLDGLTYGEQFDAISVRQCDGYSEMIQRMGWNDESKNNEKMISILEVTFECAGICAPNPFYVFTDVNRGPPKTQKSCFEVIDSHVNTWGYIFLIIGLAFSTFLTVVLGVACAFLCCTKQPQQYNPLPQDDNNNNNPGENNGYIDHSTYTNNNSLNNGQNNNQNQ